MEYGKVVFDSMEFSHGTIVFDLAEEKEFSDFIQINGAATKTSVTAELIFDINISASELEGWLSGFQEDECRFDVVFHEREQFDRRRYHLKTSRRRIWQIVHN